jgi:hypothetical protein
LLVSQPAAQAGNAIAELQTIQQKLEATRTDHNWTASLVIANDLTNLLNRSPNALLELARAKVHTNDLAGAFRDLETFVRMGQSADLGAASSEFAPLREKPAFAAIQTGMEKNQTAISLAKTAFQLSDPTLLPEDIDYEPNTKHFFLTTVRGKKIISADQTGTVTEFAKAPDDWPLLAIKLDPGRNLLWATEVALQGFVLAPEADWGRSAVLCYDLKTGKLLRRIEGPHGSGLGDMALTPDGAVIVSDGDGGGVYRIQVKAAGLERLDTGDFVSPQTPAVEPDGKTIFVPDYVRGIAIRVVGTKEVRWLGMEDQFALNGIDGLYLQGQTLIAVQNGTSPERVIAFALDPARTKIISETIIERSTKTLGDPTHGVVVGNDFYYIANSGWDIIDEHGNLKPGEHPSAAFIMSLPLSSLGAR